MPDITEIVVSFAERLAALEQRFANMVLEGPVAEVNPETQKVRLRIGGTDQEPQLSPWIPYTQSAGAMKFHTPPSVGQPMFAISKDGVVKNGRAIPDSWSRENPSPSAKGDEDVYVRGNLRITFRGDRFTIELGDTKFEITADELALKSTKITENEG